MAVGVGAVGRSIGPVAPFWHIGNTYLNTYAKPVEGGSPHMRLYTTPDPSGAFSWQFAHKEKAKAAVHIIPVVKTPSGEEFVRFIVQTSPIMGGRPILQLPAGTRGMRTWAKALRKPLAES